MAKLSTFQCRDGEASLETTPSIDSLYLYQIVVRMPDGHTKLIARFDQYLAASNSWDEFVAEMRPVEAK